MEFKEALKEILIIRGSSALKDETTLKLLDDYGAFDEHPAFRSLMKTVISAKIGEMLQDTFYFLVKDKGQAWEQMKNKLVEMMPYDKVIMDAFFGDLEIAFIRYAYERGSYDRDINSDVKEMLGQVWTDEKGVKYSLDKKKLINGSEAVGNYEVNPETENIDLYAFYNNKKIKGIAFPQKLKEIGNQAFQNCSNLSNANFQGDINQIGEGAFGGCSSIKEIYLPGGLKKINAGLFSVCINLLYVHIPDTVIDIAVNAFKDCLNLQYVIIPSNVTAIGDYAFENCNSLYYVILPSKLESIGEGIFDNCKVLTYIGIPKGTRPKFESLMPQYASLFIEYDEYNDTKSDDIRRKTNDILDEFQGKTNVRHIISDNGSESWLTQEVSFADEAYAKRACGLNTVENEKKHVLFLFNDKEEEVGRYYMVKKLQGKTPDELIKLKSNLSFFESWNPEIKNWVPCVGIKTSFQFKQPHVIIKKEQETPFPSSGKDIHDYKTNMPIKSEDRYGQSNENRLNLTIHVCEIDLAGNGNFMKLDEENWTIGDKCIITPHGELCIKDAKFVEEGPLVGVEFTVEGKMKLYDFSCSTGNEKEESIKTFALMRQPHNAWLWAYMFDNCDTPIVNFCGFDDLDGFSKFVTILKESVDKHGSL